MLKRGILAAALFASGCAGTRETVVQPAPELQISPSAPVQQAGPAHDVLFDQREYARAVAAFQLEATTDPEMKFRYERLAKLLERVGFTAVGNRTEILRRDSPAAELAHKAISAFFFERDRQALLLAAAAHGSAPKEEAFRLLLQGLEAWTGRAAEAGEILPPEEVARYKLRRAEALFEEKRYEDAALQCREALLLDPENAELHERLGSMYYALGSKELALDSWSQSLVLNPENPPLKDFMARFHAAGPAARTP